MKKIGFLHKVVVAVLIGCCSLGVGDYFLKADVREALNSEECCKVPQIEGFNLIKSRNHKLYAYKQEGLTKLCHYEHGESGAVCLFALDASGENFRCDERIDEVKFSIKMDVSAFDFKGLDKAKVVDVFDYFCLHYCDDDDNNDRSGSGFSLRSVNSRFSCISNYIKEFDSVVFSVRDVERNKEQFEMIFKVLNSIKQRLATEDGRTKLNELYEKLIYKEVKNEKGEKVKSGDYFVERSKRDKNNNDKSANEKLIFDNYSFSDFVRFLEYISNCAPVMIGGELREKDFPKYCKYLDEQLLRGRKKASFPIGVKDKVEEAEETEGRFEISNAKSDEFVCFVPNVESGEIEQIKNNKYRADFYREYRFLLREEMVIPILKGLLAKTKLKELAGKLGYEGLRVKIEYHHRRQTVVISFSFYGNDEKKFTEPELKKGAAMLFELLSQEKDSEQERREENEEVLRKLSRFREDIEFVSRQKNSALCGCRAIEGMELSLKKTGDAFALPECFLVDEKGNFKDWDRAVADVAKNKSDFAKKFGNVDSFIIDVYKCIGENKDENKDKQLTNLIAEFVGYDDFEKNKENLLLYCLSQTLCSAAEVGVTGSFRRGRCNVYSTSYPDFGCLTCDLYDCFGTDEKRNEEEEKRMKEFLGGKFKDKVKNFSLTEKEFDVLKQNFSSDLKRSIWDKEDNMKHAELELKDLNQDLQVALQDLQDIKDGKNTCYLKDEKAVADLKEAVKCREGLNKRYAEEILVLKNNLQKLKSISKDEFVAGINKFADYPVKFSVKSRNNDKR